MRERGEEERESGDDGNPGFRIIYGTATEPFGFGLSRRILGDMPYNVSISENRFLEADNL